VICMKINDLRILGFCTSSPYLGRASARNQAKLR
jgi:hypothetical protein